MQGLGSAQPLRAPAAVKRTRTMHSKNLHILAIRHTPSAHITIQPFIKLEQCARFSSFFFLFLPSPAHVRLLHTYRSQTIVSPPMQQYSRLCIHLIDVPPAILGAEDHTFTNAKAATSLWRCCVGRAALWKRISLSGDETVQAVGNSCIYWYNSDPMRFRILKQTRAICYLVLARVIRQLHQNELLPHGSLKQLESRH